jgi:tetratricopeptide (TPR) repeat protein
MAMPPRFWLIASSLCCLFLTNCEKSADSQDEASFEKFDSPWAHEEHWMVARTVQDLQGMLKLCGAPPRNDATTPTAQEREYQVGAATLKMAPSCWDIASYQALFAGWKATPQVAAKSPQDLLHILLTPTAKVLQNANQLISERITASPAAPEVHEEAAFLLGVFGMRENARHFGDLRPLLGRMTAHLALAHHLRAGGQAGPIGEWARVFYDLHAGRPRLARERLQATAADGDSGRWRRAVELLISMDWRRTGDLNDLSLAEGIAHSRALQMHLGNPAMMEFVTQHPPLQGTPDWSRMLSGLGHSVEEGHLAMRSCLGMEFYEMAAIFKVGENPDPAKIASSIAQQGVPRLVGETGAPKVISDADWAAYFRRHFYKNCSDISHFVLQQWSSPEAAVEWENTVMSYCRLLPDHELVESLVSSSEKRFHKALKATAAHIRQHPERVPMGLWYDYQFSSLEVSVQTRMPDQASWFREVSPPGTAHDPTRRLRFSGIAGNWLFHMKELHAIDPWNPHLCYEIAEESGHSLEGVKAAWGELREYSKRPLRQTLKGANLTIPQRIETLQILIDLDPSAGLQLGSILVMENRPAEAIEAYEKAYQKSPDRVAVANQSRWMIHYYKSKGDDAKAREIADHHAEVYSQAGLEAAMALAILEKDGKRARELAAAIEERYGCEYSRCTVEWLISGDENALRQIFPDGLREVTLSDFSTEKKAAGCQVMESSSTLLAVGMRPGDRVVAIDGKRVENFQQYLMLMSGSLDPSVHLIFQRGRGFQEIRCQLPDRRLQVDMRDSGQ